MFLIAFYDREHGLRLRYGSARSFPSGYKCAPSQRKHSVACRVQHVLSYFRLPHFSSQTFSVAVPADKTVRRIITPFTLPIFMARHRLIVRTSSVRQILERLFDFVVLQFDTPLECKKAETFDFSKVPALPI